MSARLRLDRQVVQEGLQVEDLLISQDYPVYAGIACAQVIGQQIARACDTPRKSIGIMGTGCMAAREVRIILDAAC